MERDVLVDPALQRIKGAFHSGSFPGIRPVICLENAKRRRFDGLRNQQTGARNFVKLFYKKSTLLGEVSPSKGRCFRFNCKNKEIMGVQITMNTRIRDMTSMLDTIKTRVWKTPEKLDAMRFLPHGIYSV